LIEFLTGQLPQDKALTSFSSTNYYT